MRKICFLLVLCITLNQVKSIFAYCNKDLYSFSMYLEDKLPGDQNEKSEEGEKKSNEQNDQEEKFTQAQLINRLYNSLQFRFCFIHKADILSNAFIIQLTEPPDFI